MARIETAVIPAAGRGTRMAPLSDYLPKPMLPLGKQPVLQHIVDEVKEAGIRKIGIVIHPDHEVIASYFKDDPSIHIIFDNSISGPGGAILKATEFINNNFFLTIFSDAPVIGDGKGEHLQHLAGLLDEGAEAALSIYQVPQAEAARRGIVLVDKASQKGKEGWRMEDMLEKPSAAEYDGPQWASACRYVGGPALLEALRNSDKDEQEELQFTTALRQLLHRDRPVLAMPMNKRLQRHDTGNFEGYYKALRAVI